MIFITINIHVSVCGWLQKAMRDYSVPATMVVYLLYVYSGDYDVVLKHLQTGQHPEGIDHHIRHLYHFFILSDDRMLIFNFVYCIYSTEQVC